MKRYVIIISWDEYTGRNKVKMMATMTDSGEMVLTDEECEKLRVPMNTVVVSGPAHGLLWMSFFRF